eukprot:TRINITY_DN18859_c0_g1_i1.p1 TRINITY_DN18859_c0_g1~~TRINITY_DN18859_c0_g1_i1.p1  ORF type:complete len:577 (+),score=116.39 TRINITY_DN18859_c0_g1_i1:117-1847(+)
MMLASPGHTRLSSKAREYVPCGRGADHALRHFGDVGEYTCGPAGTGQTGCAHVQGMTWPSHSVQTGLPHLVDTAPVAPRCALSSSAPRFVPRCSQQDSSGYMFDQSTPMYNPGAACPPAGDLHQPENVVYAVVLVEPGACDVGFVPNQPHLNDSHVGFVPGQLPLLPVKQAPNFQVHDDQGRWMPQLGEFSSPDGVFEVEQPATCRPMGFAESSEASSQGAYSDETPSTEATQAHYLYEDGRSFDRSYIRSDDCSDLGLSSETDTGSVTSFGDYLDLEGDDDSFEDCLEDDNFALEVASGQASDGEHKRQSVWRPSGRQFPIKKPQCMEVSPTSWAAQQQRKDEDHVELDMARTLRSILNKLTADKLDKLYTQIVACNFDNKECITILVEEVFEKATRQHGFISLYVELCSRLHTRFMEQHGAEDGKLFRRRLLSLCQTVFQDVMNSEDDFSNLSRDEREEAEAKRRVFVLGVFKLIGALLARGLLARCILPNIIDDLLQFVGTGPAQTPSPQSLEYLTVLLSAVGAELDVKTWTYHAHLCECFDQVRQLQANDALPIRTRCLLQNLLDLRAAGWK